MKKAAYPYCHHTVEGDCTQWVAVSPMLTRDTTNPNVQSSAVGRDHAGAERKHATRARLIHLVPARTSGRLAASRQGTVAHTDSSPGGSHNSTRRRAPLCLRTLPRPAAYRFL